MVAVGNNHTSSLGYALLFMWLLPIIPWLPYINYYLFCSLQLSRKKAKDVHKKHSSRILRYPGVTAVDIGFRTRGGILHKDGNICLLVWVKKKLPESDLDKSKSLPKEIEGVSVDVLEGEVIYAVCLSHY